MCYIWINGLSRACDYGTLGMLGMVCGGLFFLRKYNAINGEWFMLEVSLHISGIWRSVLVWVTLFPIFGMVLGWGLHSFPGGFIVYFIYVLGVQLVMPVMVFALGGRILMLLWLGDL